MSALTASGGPAPGAAARSGAAPAAPPSRTPPGALALVRTLLRLHRTALGVWVLLVLALSAVLLCLAGPFADEAALAWREYNSCALGPGCGYDQDAIVLNRTVATWTTAAVLSVPFLVAAWAGGSLIGRELESGTAGLAWTQGLSPARWFAAKLAVPAAVVAVSTALLAVLHHTAWSSAYGRVDNTRPWYTTSEFYANGPTVLALSLAGLALGALCGIVWRRSLPALVAGPAALGLLWIGVHPLMPYLWPGVSREGGMRHGIPGEGLTVGSGFETADGARHGLLPGCRESFSAGCRTAYEQQGAVRFFHDYHPASHYLPLQLVTAAVLLAVAAAAAYAGLRLLRRRTEQAG